MFRPVGRGPVSLPLPTLVLIACSQVAEPPAGALLVDVTLDVGLPEPEGVPPNADYFLPEIMHGGVGLFDYDGDGALDLLHVRTPLPGGPGAEITNRLYHQGTDGRFVDVTERAGLARPGFGQGLAVGDVDNDGDIDVYITNLGPDEFYLNDGEGAFERATQRAGFAGARWSTAASFFDSDVDGWLDLYVAHYLQYDLDKVCWDPGGRQEYCGPWAFRGQADKLYRNRGNGTFEDVTRKAGIVLPKRSERATGLGVLTTDLTGDGLIDVFVANDLQVNQLWVNRGDGTFSEEGILRGVASDEFGHPEASMGVTAGDVNGDGALDIFMTHLVLENNRLFLGAEGVMFDDGTVESGMNLFDRMLTGWGCGFFDFDLDGDHDLAIVNGGVRRRPRLEGAPEGMWGEYAEPNLLFVNDGRGVFSPVEKEAGAFASLVEVSRGLALGDLDQDGDVDLVVSGIGGALRVFRNDAPPPEHHWLAVRALVHGRDALGAQVRLHTEGGDQCCPVLPSSSYMSSSEPRAHFGLGRFDAVENLEVLWPDGARERFRIEGVDRVVTLRRGAGEQP